ncbi:sigma-70 family RNA polymerase sigma factor [Actinokineospora auranticolor]|uniref:RNA polymerase sigma factor (Sigma-70 family) n=1 Tax=Actinokineospora auranticolor TaxID=155976 RepID=A0A2S6GH60_9PSEU|nr:sigma-70 family RNA polymerase sigma factor [Actinokineospora auranticolor]PPK64539.1 RNA polymerase sigma factor (sigma-70 family) [Actinokineospora auranticolor]
MGTEAELLGRAVAGDQQAWRALVQRYSRLVWRVARAHRLDAADAADVSQNTWIALTEHAAAIRMPDRLAGWLATTARRECLRVLERRGREVPVDRPGELDLAPDDSWPEVAVLRSDRDDLLWSALTALSERCRKLLGLLAFAPELTYPRLARALGLSPASVGRTRGRCLGDLRRKLALLGMPEGAVG